MKAAEALLVEEKATLARSSHDAYRLAASEKSEYRANAWRSLGAAKAAREEAARLLGLLRWLDGADGHFDPAGWAPHVWTPEVAVGIPGGLDRPG